MKPKVLISKFSRDRVYMPSFIGALQIRLYSATKNEPKGQKYNLILAPADEPVEKTPARAIAEYYETALSQEELADLTERVKAIPPEQMKEMFKEWWAVAARQYLADNGLEELNNESSSSETDESRENTSDS